MFQPGLFKGKRILVTGGGTGLGREMVDKYLELGADIYICGRRKEVLDQTAKQLMQMRGGSVKTRAIDIRDAEAVDKMVEWIWNDGGPLTGLVNNAAGNFISRTEDLSHRGFDAIANTVFHGTFYTTHAVGKRWIKEGDKGSVISIVVTWIWTGSPFVVPSAMSKAGIHVMTQSLAVEWGRYGIRLNAIAPVCFPPKARASASTRAGTAKTAMRRKPTPCTVTAACPNCRTSPLFSWPTAANGSPARRSPSMVPAGRPTAARSRRCSAGVMRSGSRRAR
jgi:NAD(P)-dependent dehydrogenase (short-subunit alcohol dehydrogenase family)